MVDFHPAVLTIVAFFRPQREPGMNTMFSDTRRSNSITPKGLWELFIRWVVPASKFDWLAYCTSLTVMLIPLALSPLHSPSDKVGYLGPGWKGTIIKEQGATVYIHSHNK